MSGLLPEEFDVALVVVEWDEPICKLLFTVGLFKVVEVELGPDECDEDEAELKILFVRTDSASPYLEKKI